MQGRHEKQGAATLARRNLMSGIALAGAALVSAGSGASLTAGGPARAEPLAKRGQTTYGFRQVDVFSPEPFGGNPLAVVVGADRLSDADMILFSKWTNLSETSFLLKPVRPEADYRVRIFSLGEELPFAGHPTLGSCQAWLASGGRPKGAQILQECGIGLVRLRQAEGRLAFAAPPLNNPGPLAPDPLDRITRGLGLAENEIVASQRLDGGLGQPAIMIQSRERLLTLKPDWKTLGGDGVGVIAPYGGEPNPGKSDFEVRMFDPTLAHGEDPVTGSLNASLAQWLIGAGMAPPRYLVSQGTVLGRTGRVHVDRDGDAIWIGGDTVDRIIGQVTF